MPTGVTVRLYRTCSCSSTLFYRVAQLVPGAASPQFVDNVADATADVAANLLPLTQNRQTSGAGGLGYYEFVPGVPLVTTTSVSTKVASPAFSGKGWVVDAPGRVSIASGTWTFTTKFKGTANAGNTAHLVIGMWIVGDTGAVVGSPLIDPTGAGENMTANIATTAGTVSAITTTINGVPAISLAADQHLYVQLWRRQTATVAQTITTLFVYDGVATIAHPAANGFPNVPALGSVAARVNTTPQLSATFADPDVADTGTVAFQLCSDAACSAMVQSGSSASGVANGANGTWTPTGLAVGTYYWRAQSTDSAGNVSGWSSTSSFVVDTVPPGAPTLNLPAAGARVNSSQLGATFVDSDASDSGTVSFQLCSNASCSSVVASSTSATVGPGTAVSWTPAGLADGAYYWRLRATDAAGNQSGWTASQSFVLVPLVPAHTAPAGGSRLNHVPTLTAVYSDPSGGNLEFQVCSSSACYVRSH